MLGVTLYTHNKWQCCCYCVFRCILILIGHSISSTKITNIMCHFIYSQQMVVFWLLVFALISLPWRNGSAPLNYLLCSRLTTCWLIAHICRSTMLLYTMIPWFGIINNCNILNYESYIVLYILNIEYLRKFLDSKF